MSILKADIHFENTFKGELVVEKGRVAIGMETGEVLPYDMLFGALASCVYATFIDVMAKKRLPFDKATIHVEGEKRTEIPTTLRWVHVGLSVSGAQNPEAVRKSFELATKYCSIYQTIAKVADMEWSVDFD